MIKIYSNFNQLTHIQQEWDQLAESMEYPSARFYWYLYAAQYLHERETFVIACLFDTSNKLKACAAFYKDPANRLSIIGDKTLGEPNCMLYDKAEDLESLLSYLHSNGHPLLLNRVSSNLQDIFDSAYEKQRGLHHSLQASGSQYIDFHGSFEDFEERLSSRRKSDLRRALNKAKKLGVVDFKFFHPADDKLPSYLNAAFKVENASWKGKTGSSILHNKGMEGFLRNLFQTLPSTDNRLIGFLYIDEIPVATYLIQIFANRAWVLKIGYDENFRNCSPGILLTHQTIRYCHELQLTGIEFLGSKEEWLNLWQPEVRNYVTFLDYPVSYSCLKAIVSDAVYLLKSRIASLFSPKSSGR